MNEPIKTIGDRWYWAIYECRLACIQASPKNDGFWAHGQEWMHPWNEARVIREAYPPPDDIIGESLH